MAEFIGDNMKFPGLLRINPDDCYFSLHTSEPELPSAGPASQYTRREIRWATASASTEHPIEVPLYLPDDWDDDEAVDDK
jgi:hypothetical protein